ncbi:MAG: diguanylate cyclase domain-containing protein [Spirochaetaceae bacterium]
MGSTESPEGVDELNRRVWIAMLSNPRGAIPDAELAYERSRKIDYPRGRGASLLNLGWIHRYLGENEAARQYLKRSLTEYKAVGDSEGVSYAYNGLGSVETDVGEYDTALDYLQLALQEAREHDLSDREVAALNNIGELLDEAGREEEALEYYLQARELLNPAASSEAMGVVLANLGGLYRKVGRREEAKTQCRAAIEAARAVGDVISEATALSHLGLIALDEGNCPEAERLQTESLRLCAKSEYAYGRLLALHHLSELFSSMENDANAIPFLLQVIELGREIGFSADTLKAFPRASAIYEAEGELSKALGLLREYQLRKERLLDESMQRQIRALSASTREELEAAQHELNRIRTIELREQSRALELANRRLKIVNEIGREITATLNLEEVMHHIYDRLGELIDAPVFGIALYDERGREIEYRLFMDRDQRVPPFTLPLDGGGSFAGWCVENRRPLLLGDAEAEWQKYLRTRGFRGGDDDPRSIIYVPLLVKDRTVGVTTIQSYNKNAYTEEDLETLSALASYLAIAVDNSLIMERLRVAHRHIEAERDELEQAYENISYLANHDNLTGLPNRRHLEERLDLLVLEAKQGGAAAAFYIDLDQFKPINDSEGHLVGDRVLAAAAKRIRKSLRSTDTVARIGGDEFLAIIEGVADRETLSSIARKVLDSLGNRIVVDGRAFNLGASIGIARLSVDTGDPRKMITLADQAMYTVKKGHRGGFVFHEDLGEEDRSEG